MKTHLLYAILFLFLTVNPLRVCSQEETAGDTVRIGTLFQTLEEENALKIYTDLEDSVRVVIGKNEKITLQVLKRALANSPYRITEYEKIVFILKGGEVATEILFPLIAHEGDDAQDYAMEVYHSGGSIREATTSENRVYVIGDPYTQKRSENIVLKGKVTNAKTGEELIGVNIALAGTDKGAVTDVNGEYSLLLPAGHSQLNISGFNIKNARRQIMAHESGTLHIALIDEVVELDEVTIFAGRINQVKNVEIGVEKLQADRIKNIPTVLGEVDILRAIQTLPGVKTVGEASTGFNVRGGATDQNLILFNEGTIYNPNHLFGFFSAFSSDLIKEAELYKSSIPAKYGGRISSVLELTGREASKEKFTGSANLGLVTSKLCLEIPLQKEKSSLLVSGRTTYSDWILNQIPEKSGYKNGKAGFYDWGAVLSQKINDKNQLNIYAYNSHDRFNLTDEEKYAYNNLNLSAKWRNIINDRFFGNYSIGYDHYDYKNESTRDPYTAARLSFNIDQFFVKAAFSYSFDSHQLNFGLNSMLYRIVPGKYSPIGENSLVRPDKLEREQALESALYLSDEWEISDKFLVSAGIRYSMFNALGPQTWHKYHSGFLPQENTLTDTIRTKGGEAYKTYHGPEFRFSARYLINDDLSVKGGFNSMRQYIHRLTNTVIMSPTDTWKLSDANIQPQKGWQAAGGLYYNAPSRDWEASLEVYYKQMDDYLDYRGGAVLLMNHHIETDVVPTKGKAYGVELAFRKAIGKLNGWVSYTFSRTFLRQSDSRILEPVNDGDWYPTDYDKPHDFKLVGNYKFTQRYSLSVNVDYSTGRPTTIPAGRYYDPDTNTTLVYYTDRNSYRIPDYFRTDISFNIEPSHKLTLLTHSSVSIGLYNVTGRRNVYSIYFLSEGQVIKGYKLSIFGTPIPFITYNIRF